MRLPNGNRQSEESNIRTSVFDIVNGPDNVGVLVGRIAAFTQNAAELLAKKLEMHDREDKMAFEGEMTEGARTLIETLTRDGAQPTANQVRALFLSQIIPMLISEALEPFQDEEGSDKTRLTVAPFITGLFDAAQLGSKSIIQDPELQLEVQGKLDDLRKNEIEPSLTEKGAKDFH